MPDPKPQDDALLARLNALKKTSVSFGTSPSGSLSPSAPAPSSTADAPDDLASRFARLGSASPSNSPRPSRATSANNTSSGGAPVIAPGAPSYLEGIAEGIGGCGAEVNAKDERSLADLIEELGPSEDWTLSANEGKDIKGLLKDIRTILPEVQKSRHEESVTNTRSLSAGAKPEGLTDWENVEVDFSQSGVRVGREGQDDLDQEHEGTNTEQEQRKTEDEEADDVIARVMAELEISRKYDPPSPPSEDDKASGSGDQKAAHNEGETPSRAAESGTDDGGLSLPSAPTSLPEDDFDRTQALEDALTSRLAALAKPQSDSLGLPSAPSFAPTNKPPKIQSSFSKPVDDEVDTWCVICTDDATLRCLGCDGDLYCQRCWMEGHKGESAGYEERMHKAVLYSKKKKQAAAAG